MKKNIFFITIGIFLTACGGSSGDDTPPSPPEIINKAPSTPTQIYPENNALCINNTVNFSWNAASDPENDALTYVVEVSKNNTFTPVTETKTVTTTSTSISLEKGVAFYWRVKAKDSKNSSDFSSSNSFYTEGEGYTNHIPFVPELVAPNMNTIEQNTTTDLKWNANDVDNDALTFDVYFDTNNPPVSKIGENITDNTLNVTLEASKDYFWKIVVKDNKGGIAIGQIWNFKTD